MSTLQFQKGRGRVMKGRLYTVVFVPGDYSFGNDSVYYTTDNSDPVFWLSQAFIGGNLSPFLTSDPDLMLPSRHERILGAMQFVMDDRETLRSIESEGMNPNLELTLRHDYHDEMFIGTPLNIINTNQPLLFYKRDTSDTSNYGRLENIISDDAKKIKPTSFLGEIASGNLTSTSDYLDISGFTKTGSTALIPSQGILLVYSNSGVKEYIKYDYYDPVDQIFSFSQRGMSYTDPVSWNGNFFVKVFDPANPSNFDTFTSSMQYQMKAYVLPDTGETYHRPHITMKYMYSAGVYFRATDIWSSNTGTKQHEFSHHPVTWFLYSKNNYPDSMTTDMSSYNPKIVSKSNNIVSDIHFTNPFEADQGVRYDYCEENEYCGSCMGNTQDQSNICIVKGNAYSEVQEGKEPNEEAPSYEDDKDWNKRNHLENYVLPLTYTIFSGVIIVILLIIYGVIYRDFRNEMKESNIDKRMGNWIESSIAIKDAGIASGVLCFIFFGAALFLVLYGSLYGKNKPEKRFFPFVNFDRSKYNPPPGYTFVNAPTADDKSAEKI